MKKDDPDLPIPNLTPIQWRRKHNEKVAQYLEGAEKHDSNKLPFHLLPPGPIQDVVDVLGSGAMKYGAHNWRQGAAWSRYSSAALRHIFDWMDGEDCDIESGKPHLAHAVCSLLFLLEYGRRELGEDNRLGGTPDKV